MKACCEGTLKGLKHLVDCTTNFLSISAHLAQIDGLLSTMAIYNKTASPNGRRACVNNKRMHEEQVIDQNLAKKAKRAQSSMVKQHQLAGNCKKHLLRLQPFRLPLPESSSELEQQEESDDDELDPDELSEATPESRDTSTLSATAASSGLCSWSREHKTRMKQ